MASTAGVFRYDSHGWTLVLDGSSYALSAFKGDMFAGTWRGLYRIHSGAAERIDSSPAEPVVALWADQHGVIAASQTALYALNDDRWSTLPWKGSKAIRSVTREPNGEIWVATGMGAYHGHGGQFSELYQEKDLLTGELRAVAVATDGSVWLGGLGGVDVYRNGHRAEWHNTTNGMPNQDVRCLAAEADGTVWAGTALGAVRRVGSRWSLRHSRRWLPSDDVLAIAIAPDRTVWVATSKGLSAIRRREMTLAEKADHYLKVCLSRHVRPPYLVEQCDLQKQGDTNTFTPRDDDNEGGYTGLYLAMESFRYAVTGDAAARDNARRAFRTMQFLQEVTRTSGFFARTVAPSDWTKYHDPDEHLNPEESADRYVQNPRDKLVGQRWRKSADGKWLWKGDTSSDEVTAHFFGYLVYYNFAADEAERELIRSHVRRIVDYIVDGGYTLRDIDGKPTKWGVWSPEKLNGDPDWRAERWLNALEILSYLRTAEYMTGDAKYRRAYLSLLDEHHYDAMARRPLGTEPSERTNFDEELLGLVLPGALTEPDPARNKIYQQALTFWGERVLPQNVPVFTFIWASLANPGDRRESLIADAVGALRDEPLDLVQWTVDNRGREDVRLVHWPMLDDVQTDRALPPSERATIRSDSNVYSAVRGEDGMSESSGVFWLLPYWMGRYYGYLGAPTPSR
jgi:hypothetical protein